MNRDTEPLLDFMVVTVSRIAHRPEFPDDRCELDVFRARPGDDDDHAYPVAFRAACSAFTPGAHSQQ